ncbi:MAG: DUF2723 domain-containing protein [Pedosphaera sp.]|nr:DUF2723 domain-containing protein [Pedosphaera sp.]
MCPQFGGFQKRILLTITAVFQVKRRLPLYVSLGALLVYVATLGSGTSLPGLSLAANVAGWDWQPMTSHPLLWLVTSPLRLVPSGWVPFGLNLLSAGFAAATLGLLARSVELLLPHLILEKSPTRGVPVIRKEVLLGVTLASVVCGMEFTFWQAATAAATGELLDLLLLASAVWLLLEHRSDKDDLRPIYAAAFVWGLGMAENWLLLLTMPLFVAVLVWLRRLKFFERKFLLRMAALGLAGFSIYALLPLVNGLTPLSPWKFGEAWVMSFRATKGILWALFTQFALLHQMVLAIVAFYFLLPIGACLVRQQERDYVWFSRGLRALLLLACLWPALDPLAGPRQIIARQTELPLALLTFDYVNALGAGYLAGYFFLIAQVGPRKFGKRNLSWRLQLWLGRATAPLLTALLALMTVALIWQNAPVIWQAKKLSLADFGELAVRDLPADGGVVLSDDPSRRFAFQAALSRRPERHRWLAVDTLSLADPEYRRRLEKIRPSGWRTDSTGHRLDPRETVELLQRVARSSHLYYLHPSFGHFFEAFTPQPRGALFALNPANFDHFASEPLATNELAQAEKVWDEIWQQTAEPLSRMCQPPSIARKKFSKSLAVNLPPPHQSRLLGEWFSIAFNAWGVELQRAGNLKPAQRRFEQALALNTNNLAALLNLRCNADLQADNPMDLSAAHPAATQIGDLRRLAVMMQHTGPFDVPAFCYLLGCAFEESGQRRQAVQQFDRARALAPGARASSFALAKLYSTLGMGERVAAIANQLRQSTHPAPLDDATDVQLSLLEAKSWFSRTNSANAGAVLEAVLKKYPADVTTHDLVTETFFAFGDYSNSLRVVRAQLAATPDNVSALINQSAIQLLTGEVTNALAVLDHVLTLTNSPRARLNRGTARLKAGQLDAAESDFLQVTNFLEANFQRNYGLGKVALQRHDTNLAIHHFQLCISNSPAGTFARYEAEARLEELKPPAPKK